MTVIEHPWWKNASIYQIYPASFKDSNGDGIGDLQGIISELDYIQSLGVDAIWVCPMYDSPQIDMGYDISDYEAVYPPYGTLADMEQLITECHSRGMRILLDLVINHTSHLHKWFQASRSSKDDPKRDWYIWRPATYDANGVRKPPNNWRSNFGGSVWEWDEHTQEYYLHLFCPEQPDLNWENPETRAAIYESAMEFWLRKGVDGFRVDTVNMYSKTPDYRDAPIIDASTEWQFAGHLYCNGPRMHEFLGEMNAILAKYGAMTVGELPNTPDTAKVLKYVSAREKQLDMTFQFDVVDVGCGTDQRYDTTPKAWTLASLKDAFQRTQAVLTSDPNIDDAWTTVFLENHDQARSISRFGSDRTPELRELSGKMLAMLQGTLSGTLFLYQGQELGMVNLPMDWDISEYKDVASINYYDYVKEATNSDPAALQRAHTALQHVARDHSRAPMQWDQSANGGFTRPESTPWMRVNSNHTEINARSQIGDKKSVFSFWQKVLQLRREFAGLFVHGRMEWVDKENENLFLFEKRAGGRRALVALNFTEEERPFDVEKVAALENKRRWKRVIGNYESEEDGNSLKGFEGRVYVEVEA